MPGLIIFRIRNNLQDPEQSYLKINITASRIKFVTPNLPLMFLGDDSGYIN